jgi:thiol-disulfide isomerase/thioredoxin
VNPSHGKSSANYGKYDFSFTTLDGRKLKLSDYAGKVVLVSVWAPWCGPCKLETPGFVNTYKQYKDRGLEILSVAVNTNENDVRSYIQKYGVLWPVGIKDDVGRQYGTYAIPDNYLFKPDGSLVKRFVGYTSEEAFRPLLEDALKSVAKTK